MDYRDIVRGCEEEMLQKLGRLVKYNSVLGEAKPGMPFGEGPAGALKEGLAIAEELGFAVTNLDYYCGYAEMGEGPELIGIAGHLDIVPAGDGWTHDPFTLTREGDKVFGRGVTDDKGPMIAALYAMKIIRDSGVKFNKRVRLLMGTNEETGSRCMEHYNEVGEPFTLGFTPDANFPGIFGEKGMLGMKVCSKNTKILSMTGGFVSNAVCHQCTTVIPSEVDEKALKDALSATPLTSFEVTSEGGKTTVFAVGQAAHASTPLLGVNAAGFTMQALAAAGFRDDFVDFYNSRIGTSCDGSGFGIKLSDDYGDLTLSNGIVTTGDDGVITCTIDCRVPVTVKEEELRAALAPYLEDEKGKTEILRISGSLFYPPDSDLVRSLYDAYTEVTGDTSLKPEVIGGGTYAKSLKNIIAFGPEWPDKDYRIHNSDEWTDVNDFARCVEIYIQAILNLLAV